MSSRETMQRTNGDSEFRQLFEEFTVKTGEKWGIGEAECWS